MAWQVTLFVAALLAAPAAGTRAEESSLAFLEVDEEVGLRSVQDAGVVPAVVSDAIDKAVKEAKKAKKKADAHANVAEVKYVEHKQSTEDHKSALEKAQTEQAQLLQVATEMAVASTKQVEAIAAAERGGKRWTDSVKEVEEANQKCKELEKQQREFEDNMFKLISEKKAQLLLMKEELSKERNKRESFFAKEKITSLEAEAAGQVEKKATRKAAKLMVVMREAEKKAFEAEKVVGTAAQALEAAGAAAAAAQSTLADATAEAEVKKELLDMLFMLEDTINQFYRDVDAFAADMKAALKSGSTKAPHKYPSLKHMLVANNKLTLVYNSLVELSKPSASYVTSGIREVNMNANAVMSRFCKEAKGHKCGLDMFKELSLERATIVGR